MMKNWSAKVHAYEIGSVFIEKRPACGVDCEDIVIGPMIEILWWP